VLKIRKYKVSDAPQIADIISKSPFGSKRYSNTKEGLKWKLNISDPEGRRLRKNTYATRGLTKRRVKKNFMVVEDNNKVIGIVRKNRGKHASLYLDKKYYRRGMGKKVMNEVNNLYTRKVANKTILKPPLSPTFISGRGYNKMPTINSVKPIGKSISISSIRKTSSK